MPNYYSYKIVRDYGFAPNPFHGICTLATCKPHVRLKADVGDWIIGSGAKTTNLEGRIIYAMEITEKVTFDDYWNNPRFRRKKPVIPAGLIRIHGDNIYYKDNNDVWHQIPSQHSNPDFSQNEKHLENDLSGKYVLISNFYFYFGNKHFQVPPQFKQVCSKIRDYQKISDASAANSFIEYLCRNYQPGVIGDPIDWKEYSQRKLF